MAGLHCVILAKATLLLIAITITATLHPLTKRRWISITFALPHLHLQIAPGNTERAPL